MNLCVTRWLLPPGRQLGLDSIPLGLLLVGRQVCSFIFVIEGEELNLVTRRRIVVNNPQPTSLSSQGFGNAVAHRPVPTMAFVPHPVQCGMTGVDEIDDANVGLGNVLAMQPAGILLQRPPA